jgi:hypothetical protein
VFKTLPREAQEIVQKREAQREQFVQAKSQEAQRAQQTAEQAAIQQLAEIEAGYAQQFQGLAEQIAPQRPNPALLQHDPQAFYAMQADYEAKVAQQRELQQQAQTYAQQAQARAMQMEQANHAEQHRIIVEQFPEYADPTTGPELQRKLTSVAKGVGLSRRADRSSARIRHHRHAGSRQGLRQGRQIRRPASEEDGEGARSEGFAESRQAGLSPGPRRHSPEPIRTGP